MSAKAIREYHGKKLVSKWLTNYSNLIKYNLEDRALLITPDSFNPDDPVSLKALTTENPWLLETKLVVKPDQLIKRRGKAGLLAINKTWSEVVEWIKERINKECKVEVVSGILDHFIVEPFVPHAQSDEYYICLQVCNNLLRYNIFCIHPSIHACIHTYIYAYMHTYMHTYIYTYTVTYIDACTVTT